MRLRSKEENRVRQIPLVQICPGKAQPRKNFSNEELLELAKHSGKRGITAFNSPQSGTGRV